MSILALHQKVYSVVIQFQHKWKKIMSPYQAIIWHVFTKMKTNAKYSLWSARWVLRHYFKFSMDKSNHFQCWHCRFSVGALVREAEANGVQKPSWIIRLSMFDMSICYVLICEWLSDAGFKTNLISFKVIHLVSLCAMIK